jgi:hypothetical protein
VRAVPDSLTGDVIIHLSFDQWKEADIQPATVRVPVDRTGK